MPEYRHPTTLDGVAGKAPARVHVARNDKRPVSDGTFEAPERVAASVADRHGVDVSDLRVGGTGTCQATKTDGETCGRERPCSYHD